MTYETLKMSELKAIATERKLTIVGDKRKKQTYSGALVAHDIKIYQQVEFKHHVPASSKEEEFRYLTAAGTKVVDVVVKASVKFGQIVEGSTLAGQLYFHPLRGWEALHGSKWVSFKTLADATRATVKRFANLAPTMLADAWREHFNIVAGTFR
jgi:hypothetical protein